MPNSIRERILQAGVDRIASMVGPLNAEVHRSPVVAERMTMRIELLKAHTNAGKPRQPGERIDIDEASAKWLIDLKVAKATAPETTKQPSRKGD